MVKPMPNGEPISPDALVPPEKPLSGYQEVLDYLRREMSLGRIRVGDRLPAERKLSERLGVARETLRQALRVLEGSGDIVVQRGSRGGAVVQSAPIDIAQTLQHITAHKDDILDVIEFRTIVESAAARLAADRRSPTDLAALDQAQADLLAADSLHACRDHDTAFHLAIAHASGNREITLAVEDARVKMFRMVDVIDYEFLRDSSYAAHERILSAIRAGDADRAAAEMGTHLAITRDEFEHIVSTHASSL